MRQVKSVQLGFLDGLPQFIILKLRHLTTLGTYLVMMRIAIVAFFVLGGGAKLVLDDQMGIHQKNNGIVKGSPADPEFFLVDHQRIKGIYIKMTVYGINGIKYGKAFGSLPMPVRLEIFRKYLLYCIFHILTFHNGRFITANKVKRFLLKAKKKRGKKADGYLLILVGKGLH